MNLDDYARFNEIDPQDMLSQIDELPDQLLTAWEIGKASSLPSWSGISNVLIAGMGGSAIGADLLAAYALPMGSVPIFVHRDYNLPAWVKGSQTLVIASSHSGDTEETLSALETALKRKCRCLVVSTGGKIAQSAKSSGIPVWRFEHEGQPRAAVGYSFALLLAVLFRLNLIPNPSRDLIGTVAALREGQPPLMADISIANNPAKRIAGQLVGRWVTVMGSGLLAPVARRWKGQISEIAKAWAQFEFIPEANHNTLAGIQNPEDLLSRMIVLFLRASSDYPRNRLRSDLTRKTFMLEGIGTDFIDAQGETRMEHLWTCLHFGDYIAYYLAMAYEVNPTPVMAIENFKAEMAAEGE